MGAGIGDALAEAKNCRGNGHGGGCRSNLSPTISGTPSAAVTIGETYSFIPTASDPEGTKLSFGVVNRPPWAAFNTVTGELSGMPGAGSEGEYVDITISVSDGSQTASLAPFSITVSSANHAPSIGGNPPAFAREGQYYEFTPTATDADGDTLSFSIVNRPAWASFDSRTGRLAGTPGTGSTGTYASITIRASDGTEVASLPAFSVTVEQASLGSATLSWQPPTVNEDGSPLTDLAGYRVRYGTSPGSYPNLLQIPNPGITTCVIENLPPGTYYFVATAYSSSGHESQYSAVVSKTI